MIRTSHGINSRYKATNFDLSYEINLVLQLKKKFIYNIRCISKIITIFDARLLFNFST